MLRSITATQKNPKNRDRLKNTKIFGAYLKNLPYFSKKNTKKSVFSKKWKVELVSENSQKTHNIRML